MRRIIIEISQSARRIADAAPVALYSAFILVLIGGLAMIGTALVDRSAGPVASLMNLGDDSRGGLTLTSSGPTTASAVLEGDEWMQNLKASFRERDRAGYKPASLGAKPADAAGSITSAKGAASLTDDEAKSAGDGSRNRSSSKTYRTMCVRLCDGYFFPISYSTDADNFEDDESACQRRCSSPARLYVYRNPGEEPEDMVSIKGQPYKKLTTAFLFRTKFDQACKCGPHPWEQEAMDRHRRYAEIENKAKAERLAQLDAKAAKSHKGRSKKAPAPEIVAEAGATARRDAGDPAASTAMPMGFVPAGGKVGLLNASSPQPEPTGTVAAAEKPAKPAKVAAERKQPKSAAKPQPEARPSAPAPQKVANQLAPAPMRLGAATRTASVAPRQSEVWRSRVFTDAR